MKYEILGQKPRKGKRWQIGEETARELERKGKVEIVDGVVKKAIYPEDELDKIQYKPFWSLFLANEVGTAQTGKDELNTIMETPMGFDTVKPIGLMKKYNTTPQNITMHIKNIYADGELEEDSTCKEFLQVQIEDWDEKRNWGNSVSLIQKMLEVSYAE